MSTVTMEKNACEMCVFLITGRQNAKSKQAINEYSVAFVDHYLLSHIENAKD